MTSKTLQHMTHDVRRANERAGWRGPDAPARSFGDDIALIHSEVSEALEAYRDHGLVDATGPERRGPDVDHPVLPKPQGVGSEFADILIRLLDSCYEHGIDLDAEYDRKMAYNATRGHRWGGGRL